MVLDAYAAAGVGASVVGSVTEEPRVSIAVGDAGQACIAGSTAQLRDAWEATSFQLERLQVAPDVVSEALTLDCVLVAPSQARPWYLDAHVFASRALQAQRCLYVPDSPS